MFPVLRQPPLVGTWPPTDALHANPYLFHLPAVGVFAKFVNKSAAVDSFQDLPLVVIPGGKNIGSVQEKHALSRITGGL